jgi:hypothetical protein
MCAGAIAKPCSWVVCYQAHCTALMAVNRQTVFYDNLQFDTIVGDYCLPEQAGPVLTISST